MSYEFLTIVIQTTVGRKNLLNIHVYATEILRRFAPPDDIFSCVFRMTQQRYNTPGRDYEDPKRGMKMDETLCITMLCI